MVRMKDGWWSGCGLEGDKKGGGKRGPETHHCSLDTGSLLLSNSTRPKIGIKGPKFLVSAQCAPCQPPPKILMMSNFQHFTALVNQGSYLKSESGLQLGHLQYENSHELWPLMCDPLQIVSLTFSSNMCVPFKEIFDASALNIFALKFRIWIYTM